MSWSSNASITQASAEATAKCVSAEPCAIDALRYVASRHVVQIKRNIHRRRGVLIEWGQQSGDLVAVLFSDPQSLRRSVFPGSRNWGEGFGTSDAFAVHVLTERQDPIGHMLEHLALLNCGRRVSPSLGSRIRILWTQNVEL